VTYTDEEVEFAVKLDDGAEGPVVWDPSDDGIESGRET
jgi:hypothetical protein